MSTVKPCQSQKKHGQTWIIESWECFLLHAMFASKWFIHHILVVSPTHDASEMIICFFFLMEGPRNKPSRNPLLVGRGFIESSIINGFLITPLCELCGCKTAVIFSTSLSPTDISCEIHHCCNVNRCNKARLGLYRMSRL